MAKVGKPKLKLNDKGIKALWDALEKDVAAAGAAVLANVDDDAATMEMKRDRNGRPVAMVAIAHPRGLAKQAKEGTLTRAAAQAGLDVKRYPAR